MDKREQFIKEKKARIGKIRSAIKSSFDELDSALGSIEVSSDNIELAPTLKHYMATNKHDDAAKALNKSKNTLLTRIKKDVDWRVVNVGGQLRCVMID